MAFNTFSLLLVITVVVTEGVRKQLDLDSKYYRIGSPSRQGQNSDTVDYLFSRKQSTWDSAIKGCKAFRSARLLSIETSQESEFVSDMINNDGLFDPPLPMGTTFWTSGAYNFKLSEWEWASSTSKDKSKFGNWTSKLWSKGQPTNPIQPLDRVTLERNGLNHSNWKTLSGNEKAFYICEL